MSEEIKPPEKLIDLPVNIRLFFAGLRESELENLKIFMEIRPEERQNLKYVLEQFTHDDLEVINSNLENFRTIKRFGKFAAYVFGFIVAGAGAAAVIKTFFLTGFPK